MSIATIELQPRVATVEFTADKLVVALDDERVILAPLLGIRVSCTQHLRSNAIGACLRTRTAAM